MPIINGQKMACAPCIRGHRSTKCNHFNERVMVPVRKPGRPLSTCPCPPARPCACGSVRVAIPKKQKCACPSEATTEACSTEEHSPAETSSPSRPSFRVAKSGSASKTRTRKQSFDATNLERMDPGSLNWIAMPDSNGSANGMAMVDSEDQTSPHDLNGFGHRTGLVPAGPGSPYAVPQSPSYGTPMPYSVGFQYAPSAQLHHGIKMEDSGFVRTPNGFSPLMPPPPFPHGNHASPSVSIPSHPAVLSPSLLPKANGSTSGDGGCCSNKPEEPPNNVTTPQHGYGQPYVPHVQSPAVAKVNGGTSGAGSCCSSKAAPPVSLIMPVSQQGYGQSYIPQAQPPVNMKANGTTSGGGSCCCNEAKEHPPASPNIVSAPQQGYGQPYMAQFQTPVNIKPQDGSFQYPTVLTYPADYGSWQQPINPAIWQQVVSRTSGAMGTPVLPATNGDTGDVVASHQCSCGEGCQCIGCLAHPFNAQMYQYVNDAYRARTNNGSVSGSSSNSPIAGPIPETRPADLNGGARQTPTPAAGPDSPLDAQTPSDGTSGREEEALSTTDYCFVDLPMWGICGGDLVSCPCGDSCECVGCLVHNNPLPQMQG
ncbi:hypothetical protein MFIFM68171_06146 [Madurella fahalii]|uniref:Copper-fist domain-containing protein n=1 Tax=Madurella fahalii TaxID=1157608 RepID=A0ABQ0GDU0_9PEZI